jgi:5,10-methenyltetrahydrofolate synthetase
VSDLPDDVPDDVSAAKREVRARLLARRRSLSAEARTAAAERVRAALVAMVRRVRPQRAAGYVPVGAEPGGPELPEVLATALGPAGVLLLPVLRTDLDLDWAPYDGPDGLVAAGRGLREPRTGRLGPEAVRTVGLIVVPAVAVDRRGVRLGRGGGSYDRALARAGDALTVALLHDGELVERLPAGPHDRPVRAAITPTEGLRWLSFD